MLNQPRATLMQQQGAQLHDCSLGSVTLQECFEYVCTGALKLFQILECV